MTVALLLQNPLRGVREQFQRGGSLTDVLYAALAVAALLTLLVVIHRIQERRSSPRMDNDPQKLFRTVAGRLRLGVIQRDLLRRMARDLELEHPTALVLSPDVFSRCAKHWLGQTARGSGVPAGDRVRQLSALSEALFGQPLPGR